MDWEQAGTVLAIVLGPTGIGGAYLAYQRFKQDAKEQEKANHDAMMALREEMAEKARQVHQEEVRAVTERALNAENKYSNLQAQVDTLRGELMEVSAKAAEWRVIRDALGENITLIDIMKRHDVQKIALATIRHFVKTSSRIHWVQLRKGRLKYSMLTVSYPFARKYLKGPPELYDNKENSEVFGADVGQQFNINDEQAFVTQKAVVVKEEVPASPSGAKGWFVGTKRHYRIPTGEDIVEGIGDHFEYNQEAEADRQVERLIELHVDDY